MSSTNTNASTNAEARKLATVSTKTHGEHVFDPARVGIVDGVTTHGRPLTVVVNAKATRADVLATGREGQQYIARTPRPTDAKTPKLTVNGVTAKVTTYERGAFHAHKSAPNVAPRTIATRKLNDPTVTTLTGETLTLAGTWYIVAMVKTLDNGRRLEVTHMVKSDTVPMIPCVNA